MIPAKYKHELMVELRNVAGQGGQDTAAAPGGFAGGADAWTFVAPDLAATPGIAGDEEAHVCGAKPEEACVRHTRVTPAGLGLRIRRAVQLILRFEV